MNDEYTKTLVMDSSSGGAGKAPSAAEVAEKIQASIDDRLDTSTEEEFIQTYSYLT